jgi:hypothetical protein
MKNDYLCFNEISNLARDLLDIKGMERTHNKPDA